LQIVRDRRNQREHEFQPLWSKFVDAWSGDTSKFWVFPRFSDACELPTIDRMLAEDDSKIPVTDERWQAVIESVPDELDEFAISTVRDVARLLTFANKDDSSESKLPSPNTPGDFDPAIIWMPSSLFRYDSWSSDRHALFSFPEIVEAQDCGPSLKWSIILSRIRYDPEVLPIVNLVLENLGLPTNISHDALTKLDGQLICLCGNPKFREPMNFPSLIRHLVDENKTYYSQIQTRRTTSYTCDLVLHNDHDLTSSQTCITMSSLNEPMKCPATADDGQTWYFDRYCKDCWILNLRLHVMRSRADMVYHMKAKHLKDLVEGEKDALFMWQLRSWKRQHPDY